MNNSILNQLQKVLGENRIKTNFILAPMTTFKMGGPAEYYFEAETQEDLITAVQMATKLSLKFTILGGASNVVVSDRGIKGLVVRNFHMEKEVLESSPTTVQLRVSSGYPVGRLVQETIADGLSGFEYHLGLPGTVGGALFMNSKWTKPPVYMGDNLISAKLVTSKGEIKTVDRTYFQFAYDHSILQATKEVLLSATFLLKKADVNLLQTRAREALAYRKQTQPFGVASSGCFFRNVDGESAGKLIDQLGLKGFSVGDLTISNKHANFVINKGRGTEVDFKKIITEVKKRAKDQLNIELTEEVVFTD